MEVSGRKVFNGKYELLCKPCEERRLSTHADGLCRQCEENICRSCFDTHKQWKLNRGHTLTNFDESVANKEQMEDIMKCHEHSSELIKFYCPQHEQVGCVDCIVLEHKTCKVEYIRDKARTFRDSKEFRDIVRGARNVHFEAKQMLSSIKNTKVQVSDINEKFKQDVNTFKEEMISHITKLTNTMLQQGADIKTANIKNMDKLEKENEALLNDISRLTQQLESETDQPHQLFVSSITLKPKLQRLKGHLDNIKGQNVIEIYEFKRDINLQRYVKDGKQLGILQRVKPRDETALQEEVKPKKTLQVTQTPVPKQPQSIKYMYWPLLDRQLLCRNIIVDGECLSYEGDVGLYVFKNRDYVEVEIMAMFQRSTIVIGVVPDAYQENQQPGRGQYSVGFNADDGCLYHESSSLASFGPQCNNADRIGCGIRYIGSNFYIVVFTRNGKRIGNKETYIRVQEQLYPAIGMHSPGEEVKVILDAEMPKM